MSGCLPGARETQVAAGVDGEDPGWLGLMDDEVITVLAVRIAIALRNHPRRKSPIALNLLETVPLLKRWW